MATINEPEVILMHFLRSELTDIPRSGFPIRETTVAETFSGDGTNTTVTLATKPVCFTSVVVNAVTLQPYLDYNMDLDTWTITFTTPPTSGTDNIVVNFKVGTNYIFTDKPRSDISESSYPRIVVKKLVETSIPQGAGEDNTYDTITFQIDVLAFRGMLCTIGSDVKEGETVARSIARNVVNELLRDWRSKISYKLFNPSLINNFPLPFDSQNNIFRQTIEISYNAFNTGE